MIILCLLFSWVLEEAVWAFLVNQLKVSFKDQKYWEMWRLLFLCPFLLKEELKTHLQQLLLTSHFISALIPLVACCYFSVLLISSSLVLLSSQFVEKDEFLLIKSSLQPWQSLQQVFFFLFYFPKALSAYKHWKKNTWAVEELIHLLKCND